MVAMAVWIERMVKLPWSTLSEFSDAVAAQLDPGCRSVE
jgi:hypothetical protein